MAAKEQVMESRKVKMGTAAIVFNIIGYILVGLVAIICLLPFIMLISGSFFFGTGHPLYRLWTAPQGVYVGSIPDCIQISGKNSTGVRCIHIYYGNGNRAGTVYHYDGSLCHQQKRL